MLSKIRHQIVREIMTTVIDGEGRIRMLMHSAVAASLALEINTGLKGRPIFFRTVSYTPMNAAREICGSTKRTKRAVLCDYVAWLTAVAPERFGCEWSPNPSVRKAMGEK
jgi:hypothetical protein